MCSSDLYLRAHVVMNTSMQMYVAWQLVQHTCIDWMFTRLSPLQGPGTERSMMDTDATTNGAHTLATQGGAAGAPPDQSGAAAPHAAIPPPPPAPQPDQNGAAAPPAAVAAAAERAKWIPMRLTMRERRLFRLLDAALSVSEYTDKVDILTWKRKESRVVEQIKDICAILSGLQVAQVRSSVCKYL